MQAQHVKPLRLHTSCFTLRRMPGIASKLLMESSGVASKSEHVLAQQSTATHTCGTLPAPMLSAATCMSLVCPPLHVLYLEHTHQDARALLNKDEWSADNDLG